MPRGDDQASSGVYAEFADDTTVSEVVQRLEADGIPRAHILLDRHAPNQSPAPIHTAERDKKTVSQIVRFGAVGAVVGFVVGGLVGGLGGALLWDPDEPAWLLLAIGAALFGLGLGLLWGLLIRKGESATTMGTIYDRPQADVPIALTVRSEDAHELDRVVEMLEAAGGTGVHRVPKDTDVDER